MGVQKDQTYNFLFFYFFYATKKTKILSIPPHFKHNIVLNVEIKEKECKRMKKIM
jgi:hypothetical protein